MSRLLERLPYGSTSVVRLDREVPLHVLVRSVGRSREVGPGYVWDGARRGSRPFAVLQVTLAGAGMVERGGRTFNVPPGSAMLVHVPDNHRYLVDPEAGVWEFVYAIFYGQELLRLLSHVNRSTPVIAWDPNGEPEAALFGLMEALRRRDRVSAYELSARAYAVAMAILAPSTGADESDRGIPAAARFIRENLASAISIEEAAGVAGYSRHHFSRRFKAEIGLTPVQYLREVRCEAAANLLTRGTLSVKEIAARCGFDSSSYFCRVFLRTTGFTPSEYRRIVRDRAHDRALH